MTNKIKIITTALLTILVLMLGYVLFNNYFLKGKVVIESQNSEIEIKNSYNQTIKTGSSKLDTRIKPGEYSTTILHKNGKTLYSFKVEARKTTYYTPNLFEMKQNQPVAKSYTPSFIYKDGIIQTIDYNKQLSNLSETSISLVTNNVEEMYLYDINKGYIKKNNGLYYINNQDLIKVNLPSTVIENYNISYSKNGTYAIWNNNYIYILNGTETDLYYEDKSANIKNLSLYDKGLYYVIDKVNNNILETVVRKKLFDKTELNKIQFNKQIEQHSSGEEGQDKPNNNINVFSSNNGENIIIQNNENNYLYSGELKYLNTIPLKFIKSITWNANDELFFSEGDGIYKYSLKNQEAVLVVKSPYAKNINNINIQNNEIFYSSYLSDTEQAIFRVSKELNDESNVAINLFPKFYINCTINYINISINTLLLNNSSKNCTDKAEANLIVNGINPLNFKITPL